MKHFIQNHPFNAVVLLVIFLATVDLLFWKVVWGA